jgi:hypothetical protein
MSARKGSGSDLARRPPASGKRKPKPDVKQSVDAPSSRRTGVRVALFVALLVVCGAVGAAYLIGARSRDPQHRKADPTREIAPKSELADFQRVPHMVFRSTTYGPAYGKVSLVELDDPKGARVVTDLTCDRVYMASQTGICLKINQGIVNTYEGEIFDNDFVVKHRFGLPGLPSRARISPDGNLAAMTVFVHGDSYAGANFSTRTLFVDTRTGAQLGNLEQFHVFDGGNEVTAINRNYWGVTFDLDSNHFYATLQVGDAIHLIKGDVTSRTAQVIHDGVECPSLSPDGTRIAYKKRVGGQLSAVHWRLHVLDLETNADVEMAETRSVDDQVEWLDNDHVLYGLPVSNSGTIETDTWSVNADGSGKPARVTPRAWSPAVIDEPSS